MTGDQTARDKLAEVLVQAKMEAHFGKRLEYLEGHVPAAMSAYRTGDWLVEARRTADAVLAAGWRPAAELASTQAQAAAVKAVLDKTEWGGWGGERPLRNRLEAALSAYPPEGGTWCRVCVRWIFDPYAHDGTSHELDWGDA